MVRIGIERINPLGWLRRRELRKHEHEWRIVKLGRICPACLVPVEVSFQEIGSNLAAEFTCPKCWRVWGYVEPIQSIRRKHAEPRPPNIGCGAGEPEIMYA